VKTVELTTTTRHTIVVVKLGKAGMTAAAEIDNVYITGEIAKATKLRELTAIHSAPPVQVGVEAAIIIIRVFPFELR
jgi:D-serine deaminase-like pyridoxal phosphate-dependent protein